MLLDELRDSLAVESESKKNLSSINPHHNDMVQRSGSVRAGFSRHAVQIPNGWEVVNRKSEERPLLLLSKLKKIIQYEIYLVKTGQYFTQNHQAKFRINP